MTFVIAAKSMDGKIVTVSDTVTHTSMGFDRWYHRRLDEKVKPVSPTTIICTAGSFRRYSLIPYMREKTGGTDCYPIPEKKSLVEKLLIGCIPEYTTGPTYYIFGIRSGRKAALFISTPETRYRLCERDAASIGRHRREAEELLKAGYSPEMDTPSVRYLLEQIYGEIVRIDGEQDNPVLFGKHIGIFGEDGFEELKFPPKEDELKFLRLPNK